MTITLPESLAGTWRPAGTRTGTTSVLVASITAETTLYEPIETASTLAQLGASDVPIRSLFAVDLAFSPPLSALGVSPRAVFSVAAPKARGQFVDTIEDEGFVVEGTRETHSFEAANGTEGRWFVLDVSYPVAPEVAAIGPDRLPAETHVAVWPTETTYGMAGGTTPLEVPADVAATIGEELRVEPDRDRERIAHLVRSIDPESSAEE
ncbi:hypothetical protein [Halosolutus halophilus]|uniref:hypothetical protein n=1 Tax=Halosolutus halophilus TaxID=1552990 RepID=UPI0022350CF9|nr:hypothetical protein [Halosolutus halophilus]